MNKTAIIRAFIYTATICLLPACQSTAKKPTLPVPGMPVSQLIASYGQPRSITQDHQLKRYVWQLYSSRLAISDRKRPSTSISSTGTVTSNTNMAPKIVKIFCQLHVTTDANGQVQSWQANGDGCQQILLNTI